MNDTSNITRKHLLTTVLAALGRNLRIKKAFVSGAHLSRLADFRFVIRMTKKVLRSRRTKFKKRGDHFLLAYLLTSYIIQEMGPSGIWLTQNFSGSPKIGRFPRIEKV